MNRFKQLGKDSLIYGVGGVIARSITFFTLPVYTRVFSPEMYGELELIILIGSFFAGLISLGMDSTLSFFFTQANSIKEKSNVVSSILVINIIWGMLSLFIGLAIVSYIQLNFNNRLVNYVFVACFFDLLLNQALNLLRLKYKAKQYVVFNILYGLLNATTALLFIFLFNRGIESILLGNILAPAILVIPIWLLHRDLISRSSFDRSLIAPYLKFGLPLFPQVIAVYVFTAADRWFIEVYLGREDLGIYSAGAKFIAAISFAVVMFRTALLPILLEALKENDVGFIKSLSSVYFLVANCLLVILAIFAPLIAFLFLGPDFRSSYVIIALLAFYPVYYSAFNIVSVGLWKMKKTYVSTILMFIGALINVGLNLLLVPKMGILGAAIATAISVLIWIILTIPASERYYKVGFNWKLILLNALNIGLMIAVINWVHMNITAVSGRIAILLIIMIIFSLQQYYFNKAEVNWLLKKVMIALKERC